jgi:SAM-dependent methyltransferase
MNSDAPLPRPSRALADLFTPERAEEIAFWSDLASGYGRVVVNWHCGAGELAVGLVKNGLHVVGVDPDPESIEIASDRETGLDDSAMLTWLCREPRLVSLPGPADFGVLSGEILGHYLVEEHRLGLLRNLFDHLRPGGAFGLTVPLAPASGTLNRTYISGPLRRLPKGVFARRVSTFDYDPTCGLLSGQDDVLVRMPDGEQHFKDTYTRHLYTPDEIFALLNRTGFISVGMWGGWDRRPLRQAVGWCIVRAERPLHRPVGKISER